MWAISTQSLFRLFEIILSPFIWSFRSLLAPLLSSSWKIFTIFFQYLFQNSLKLFFYPLLKMGTSFFGIFGIIIKSLFNFIVKFVFYYFYLIFKFIVEVLVNLLQNNTFYQFILKFLLIIKKNSFSIIWKSLQPNQLAAKLVFPIILGIFSFNFIHYLFNLFNSFLLKFYYFFKVISNSDQLGSIYFIFR